MRELPREQCLTIRFRIRDDATFGALCGLFDALAVEKTRINEDDSEDGIGGYPDRQRIIGSSHWVDYITDTPAWSYFVDEYALSKEEWAVWGELWQLAYHEEKRSNPILTRDSLLFNFSARWDFESMLDSILCGGYVLVAVDRENQGEEGVLFYYPFAGPFGGSEPLDELIECFGHTVLHDEWQRGPYVRCTVGWDFDQAKAILRQIQARAPDTAEKT
jgi:hypothetical protein